jgi:transcriptional regulator with XRE-family HTH domain
VEDWQAVADAVNARMSEMDLTQRQVSDRSGVSVATLREIQHATTSRRRSVRTLAAISRALDWHDEYLTGVLRGARMPGPTSRGTPDPLALVLDRPDSIQRDVARLARAVDRLADERRSKS